MRWRSVISPLRTGCSPTWKATSRTASIANMVFLLSRGIPEFPSPLPSSRRLRRNTRGPKTAGAARRIVQAGHLPPDSPGMPRHNKLCNSHAAGDAEGFLAQIDENHAHFAAVIGVDRARRVGHRDAVLGGQPGSRAHLGLEAHRKGNRNAGRHDAPYERSELDVLVDRGQQIGA